MKHCPQCGTSYTDESLRFCLADGSALVPATEEPTLVSRRPPQTEANFAPPTTPSFSQPPKRSRTGLKILIGVLIAGFLGIVLIAAAGAFFFISSSRVEPVQPANPSEPSTPKAPSTADTDRAKLEKEIADLKRKLEEQKDVPQNPEESATDPDVSIFETATVNSPGDGFLALRNLPNSDIGDRIAKIPHGDTVEILACNPAAESIDGRSGKWCLVTWQEQAGWVFDAWLTR
ncbi:MAG: hypothetical protein QUS14_10240 [Pyrinomonadaceae bacterium]|nr:hypothetical protein [Pyrinomonadaceae bacterium]